MFRSVTYALFAILLTSSLGCDALLSDDGGAGGASSEWQSQGPYAGSVAALTLTPEGRAYALASSDPIAAGGSQVYAREAAGEPWREVYDDGSGFLYEGPSGRLYTGRSRGGLRWRTPDGDWRNEADAFRTPTGCDSFLGVEATVYDVVERSGKTYAGTHCGLFEVVDAFERIAFPGGNVKKLALLGSTMFVIVDGELYRSSGSLAAWTRVDPFGDDARALFASVDAAGRPAAPLYVRKNDTMWRSPDGVQWTEMGGLPRAVREDSYLVAGVGGVLYATGTQSTGSSFADTAFLRSDDGGATWTEANGPQFNYSVLAAGPEGWLAASRERGMYCGASGAEAVVCTEGFATSVERIVSGADALYAYTGARTIHRLESDGTWAFRSTQRGEDLLVFGDRLVIPSGGDLERSADGGATWSETDLPFALDAAVALPSGTVFALALGGRVWRSGDEGLTWTNVPTPADAFALTYGLDGALYFVSSEGQLYTSASGTAWTARGDRLTTALSTSVNQALGVAEDGTAFLRADGLSYRLSGDVWVEADVSLRALSADVRSGRLFAGDERVFEWIGGRWNDLGRVPEPVKGIAVGDGRLHTYGFYGAFVRDDG